MPFDSPYMISYLSSIVTMSLSLLHRFWDFIAYFRKCQKNVTWPWPLPFKGQFVNPMLNWHLTNHCTKFDSYSFSHSWDMYGAHGWAPQNGSSPFYGRFVVRRPYAGTSYDRPVYQIWNLYIDPLQRHNRRWKMQKFGWFHWFGGGGRLGVTQGHQQHSHLIEHIRLTIRL